MPQNDTCLACSYKAWLQVDGDLPRQSCKKLVQKQRIEFALSNKFGAQSNYEGRIEMQQNHNTPHNYVSAIGKWLDGLSRRWRFDRVVHFV